jgi:hypothetical protein
MGVSFYLKVKEPSASRLHNIGNAALLIVVNTMQAHKGLTDFVSK